MPFRQESLPPLRTTTPLLLFLCLLACLCSCASQVVAPCARAPVPPVEATAPEPAYPSIQAELMKDLTPPPPSAKPAQKRTPK